MAHKFLRSVALVALLGVLTTPKAFAQGVSLPTAGAISQSMGGATVAAPLDATGALYWNPASISGLRCSEMSFGLGLLLPSTELSSTIPAGSLGGGFPPVTLSGSNRSNAGVTPIPTAAYVQKIEDSDFTFGLGMYGIGGFSTNYPASTSNPLLTPPPPHGVGAGQVYAELEILQLAPTVAYKLTDRLSIGVSPTFDIARLSVDPAFLAAPDDANGDGFFTYPDGTATSYTWGLGIHLGLFYTADAWNMGFSIKSPQWFEDFRANSADELGFPRTVRSEFDFPMIMSWGVAYTGLERWLFATDLRYYDYRNTNGFRTAAFAGDGAVTGLGWQNVFGLSTGVQYQVNDCLWLRMGYAYNSDPISNQNAFFNVASPLIEQHVLSVGGSYKFTGACMFSISYSHAFQNSVTGPIATAAGAIPGSSVTDTTSADLLYTQLSVLF